MEDGLYDDDDPFDSDASDDWADEWGNVTGQNCGTVNDLPDARKTTECVHCGKEIDARTGSIIANPAHHPPQSLRQSNTLTL